MKNSLWLMMIALVACSTEPINSSFVDAAKGTHTVAGVKYTVDATTGNILIGEMITYYFVSEKSIEMSAVYSPAIKNQKEFLGASIDPVTKDFSLYKKDRVDFWTAAADVRALNNHKIGGAANDPFILQNDTVEITSVDGSKATYFIDKITGHLTTRLDPANIIYHYMEQSSDNQAIFRDANKKFLGVQKTLGVSKTFMKDRTNLWNTVTEVQFSPFTEIGGDPLEFGKDWGKLSNLPGGKSFFATLSHGDKLWLVGGDAQVYTSSDRGTTWEAITASGLDTSLTYAAGVALDDNNFFVATLTKVYKSTDGGLTWKGVHDIIFTGTYADKGLKAVHIKEGSSTAPAGIYFIGGGTVVYGDGEDANWKTTASSSLPVRETLGMGFVVNKSDIYLMAGWGDAPANNSANDVWKSTDGGANWTEVASIVTDSSRWSRRDRIQTAYSDTHMYVIGGGTGNEDVWKASFATPDTWEKVTDTTGFGTRQNGSALYYPAEGDNLEQILLIGGTKNDVWLTKTLN